MSNVITLADLDEAIERQYAPLTLQVGDYEYVLQSLMRVDKSKRDEVQDYLAALDQQDDNALSEDDALAAMQYIFKAVVKDNKGEWLVKAVGNDLLRNMTLLKEWAKATQPGEAVDSPS
jgi:hypothetical protein